MDRPELIDFSDERARHLDFVGRHDLVAELDEVLLQGTRWILVVGTPGTGKSALLCHYLERLETAGIENVFRRFVSRVSSATPASGLGTLGRRLYTKSCPRGRVVPHHFVRYRHSAWATFPNVLRSLTNQVDQLFPGCGEQKLDKADPRYLMATLQNVSLKHLMPTGQILVLVIDEIDQIDGEGGVEALQRMLPSLPAGVSVLCSTRPQYRNLSWIECSGSFARIDLDATAASNEATCRAYIESKLHLLGEGFPMDAALRQAQGNIRYLEDLVAALAEESDTPIDAVPVGFTSYMEKLWRFLNRAAPQLNDKVRHTLSLAASTDAVLCPSDLFDREFGFSVEEAEEVFSVIRPVLREMDGPGGPSYRPFHQAFANYVAERLRLEMPATVATHVRDAAPELAVAPVAYQAETQPIANRYAIIVGVNNYVESPSLKYCVNDARAISATLSANGFTVVTFDDEQPDGLHLPTLQNVRAKLGQLRGGLSPNDLIFAMFSCHGLRSDDNRGYLLLSDSRPSDLEHSALGVDAIMDFLKATGARRRVLVLDACHAGADIGRDAEGWSRDALTPQLVRQLSTDYGEGSYIIAGSSAAQETYDWDVKHHGVFSYCANKALAGDADLLKQGYVTVDAFKDYTFAGVKQWWFTRSAGRHHQDVTARFEGCGSMKVVEFSQR